MDNSSGTGPLSGLLVADFSRVLAGPYCTMLLADLGADVIKVESPDGDDTRAWMPPVTEDGVSTYYLAINRNKRSVALDLKDAEDLKRARTLARRADIFVQNFKPGGLERFQLDYESVKRDNPRIIYASVSGFGTKGGRNLPGYDLMVQAMSGLMSLTGDPDGPPYRAGISLFDVMAGLHTTIGILAALNHRNKSGEGQHIDASLMASAMSGMVNQTSAFAAGGVVPYRMGNSHPSLFPYEPLPTGDGDLIVTAGNNTQFRRLCDLIGAPELPDDPRFSTNPGRTANREELRPLLAEKLKARSASEWFDLLISAGVPCGPINTVDGGIEFAQRIGLEPIVTAGSGDRARPVMRHPVTYSATPASYPLAPPELDEHGDDIRAWLADDLSDIAGCLRRRHHHAARAEPGHRPDGEGRLRRAGHVDGHTAAAHTVAGAGVRGGARGLGRPRVHADRDRRPADLPVRAGLGPGRARVRPARRRVAVPRRDRGLRAVPGPGAPGGGQDPGDRRGVRRAGPGRGHAG